MDLYVPKSSHLDEIAKRNIKHKLGEVYLLIVRQGLSPMQWHVPVSLMGWKMWVICEFVSSSLYLTQRFTYLQSLHYPTHYRWRHYTIHSSRVHPTSFFRSILMPAQTVAHLKYESFPTPARKAPMPKSNSTHKLQCRCQFHSYTVIRERACPLWP